MNSFKGMGVLNVTADKKKKRRVISVHLYDSFYSLTANLSQQKMALKEVAHSFPAWILSCTSLSSVLA